jgi:NH3-dependent NAD+ synthetase
VDALGADKVRGVMLPFRFTAQESLDDAAKLTNQLGIQYEVLPIAAAVHGFEEILNRLRGPGARRHRGKSAGTHSRRLADGDFEQVRIDGGDHRQQVRNVGRLRHALRRYEWRLQPDQGHLQDGGVPAFDLAQFMEA